MNQDTLIIKALEKKLTFNRTKPGKAGTVYTQDLLDFDETELKQMLTEAASNVASLTTTISSIAADLGLSNVDAPNVNQKESSTTKLKAQVLDLVLSHVKTKKERAAKLAANREQMRAVKEGMLQKQQKALSEADLDQMQDLLKKLEAEANQLEND